MSCRYAKTLRRIAREEGIAISTEPYTKYGDSAIIASLGRRKYQALKREGTASTSKKEAECDYMFARHTKRTYEL